MAFQRLSHNFPPFVFTGFLITAPSFTNVHIQYLKRSKIILLISYDLSLFKISRRNETSLDSKRHQVCKTNFTFFHNLDIEPILSTFQVRKFTKSTYSSRKCLTTTYRFVVSLGKIRQAFKLPRISPYFDNESQQPIPQIRTV